MPQNLKEETLQKETIYEGRNFNLQRRTVKLPTGKKTFREIIDHPGSVAIIPMINEESIILVEQFRNSVEKMLLEVPAGTLNRNEEPEDCAKRELLEETGYQARNLRKLFAGYTTPGYSNEKMHFYLATELTYIGERPEEDENIKTRIMKLDEINKMIEKGEIEDVKTVCSIMIINFERKLLKSRLSIS